MEPVLTQSVVGFDGCGKRTPEEIHQAINVFIVATLSFKLLQRGKRIHPQVSGFF
jgi:hypothetical protein